MNDYTLSLNSLKEYSGNDLTNAIKDWLGSSDSSFAEEKAKLEICEYERRYEIDSETMMRKLSAGDLTETDELCDWVMLVELTKKTPRSHAL
jgi:hypothetical protein